MNHCLRHYEEPITDYCRDCNHPYCARCLVYSFGPKKPPLCVGCALHAGGVRNGTRPPVAQAEPRAVGSAPTDRRTQRAYRRAERDAVKAAVKATKRDARRPPASQDAAVGRPVAPVTQVPAPPVAAGASRFGVPEDA